MSTSNVETVVSLIDSHCVSKYVVSVCAICGLNGLFGVKRTYCVLSPAERWRTSRMMPAFSAA
jgi:hypothetical protein